MKTEIRMKGAFDALKHDAINCYVEGPLYCVQKRGGTTLKIPLVNIFTITEEKGEEVESLQGEEGEEGSPQGEEGETPRMYFGRVYHDGSGGVWEGRVDDANIQWLVEFGRNLEEVDGDSVLGDKLRPHLSLARKELAVSGDRVELEFEVCGDDVKVVDTRAVGGTWRLANNCSGS